MFQHYAAFAHMSVRENVAFGLRIRKRPKDEIKARVDELLDARRPHDWAQPAPAQLSGGQRQRMALARALAVEPRVLLLDEPFGALDANVRAELRRWLRRLHDEQGVTTVLVTHDQEEAMEVADTIAVMNVRQDRAGRLAARGLRPAGDRLRDGLPRPGQRARRQARAAARRDGVADADEGAIEAMVSRVVHLGFEVRIELELPDGESARAQLTRAQTERARARARRHRLREGAAGRAGALTA